MTLACPRTTIAVGPQSTKGFGSPSPRPGRFIFSHYALLRFDPRLVLCGIFLFSLASSAHSQVTWLFSPYRVKVFIHFEPGLLSAEDDVHQFHKQVAAVLRPMLGNRWDFEVTGFPTEVISRSLDLRTPPPGDRLPPSWKKITDADKITVVQTIRTGVGWTVQAREWDVRLERWGPLRIVSTSTGSRLCDVVAQGIVSAHVPIGEIQVVDERTVHVAIRGGLLSEADEGVPSLDVPDLFVAVARHEDREGNARAVIPLPWTVLKRSSDVGAEQPTGITCEVVSGIRNALSARRRGRVKLYAQAVQPSGAQPVTLRLQSRDPPRGPLVGYEIYTQPLGEGSPIFVGRTDAAGQAALPAGDASWQLISIKHGRRLLARVPLVPSEGSLAELTLPNDDPRLVAETYLTGLQDELVDLVTLRTILIARMRARMIAEDWEAAQRIRDNLLKLKPREIFSSELTRQQQRIFCPDPVGQKQIDAMFSEMQRLVNIYLNPQEVESLVKQLASRQKPQPGS